MPRKKSAVNGQSFGELLIEGLSEAVSVAKGQTKAARIIHGSLTAANVDIAPPPI